MLLMVVSMLDKVLVFHEVFLVYCCLGVCLCDILGDFGFVDIDEDGQVNCVDVDMDNDGVVDKGLSGQDNCFWIVNVDQVDDDQDGVGNVCQDNQNLFKLECEWQGEKLYGDLMLVFLYVIIYEVQKTMLFFVFYIQIFDGVSEYDVELGFWFFLLKLSGNSFDGWMFVEFKLFFIDLIKLMMFIYYYLESQLVVDYKGVLQVSDNGDVQYLVDFFGYDCFFMEFNVYDYIGNGDWVYWVGNEDDIGKCLFQELNWCDDGKQLDCVGECYLFIYLDDNVCDDGSSGFNFNCEVFEWDQGVCDFLFCLGNFGLVCDCDG